MRKLALAFLGAVALGAGAARAQSAGYLWMYPALNGRPDYSRACILDAGAGLPVDNTTTSWDGGCVLAPGCWQLQCPQSTFVGAADAGLYPDAKLEQIQAKGFWVRCFSGTPIISVDPVSGTEQCTLLPLVTQ